MNCRFSSPSAQGTKSPFVCLKGAYIVDQRRMGAEGTHLRLDLKGKDGGVIKAVAFSAPEGWFNLDETIPHTFILRPVINEWNGTHSAESHLLDIIE